MHLCLIHSFLFFTHTYPYISSCFTNSPRCVSDEHKDHKNSFSDFDFERSSYISKTDFEEDTNNLDLPLEMLRLLTMEDKQILPHQEITKLVNLGIDNDKKEVKIGTSLNSSAKKEITDLLKEYTNIFAWFY